MSWTYVSSLDEFDKEITKDQGTPGRYTFNRYLYFKPDQYDQWSRGENISSVPYTAELVGNQNIPSAGIYLTGSLSNFYVNDVISIRNLSEEEHGDHCSYACVTIEYENMESKSSGGSSSANEKEEKPWDRKVDDFTVTNQEISIPLTEAYEEEEGDIVPVATTAGQVLYDFTTSLWIQRLTWTFNTKTGDYSIPAPIINSSDVKLFGKVEVPAGCGLLLPPGYRKLYYSKGNDTQAVSYDQWSFEIIVNSMGFGLPILNAGTKYLEEGNLIDICTWYVYDPEDTNPPEKHFGSFSEMMEAKKDVDAKNLSITDENKKLVWHGDYIQQPVPITKNGGIDTSAIEDPSLTYIRRYAQYEEGSWNLGIR